MKTLVVVLAFAAWLSVWGLIERRLYDRPTLGSLDVLGSLIDILTRVF